MVFLEILNAELRRVFANQVTYLEKFTYSATSDNKHFYSWLVIKYTAMVLIFVTSLILVADVFAFEIAGSLSMSSLNLLIKTYDHVPLVRQTNGLTNFNNYYEYCYTELKYYPTKTGYHS